MLHFFLYAQWEEIRWQVSYDLNGGSGKTGFIPNGTDVEDGFESLIPTQEEIESYIQAPFGKVLDAVEINGKRVEVGKSFKVTEDVTIKVLWKDKYNLVDGANQTYSIGSNKDVVIKASGDLSDLVSIKIDGTVLDKSKYKTESGSTILTLFSSYLNGLSEGDHTIEFVYNDGSASTKLTIVNNTSGVNQNTGTNTNTNTNNNINNPQTEDNIMINVFMLLISLSGLCGGILYINKKRLFNR